MLLIWTTIIALFSITYRMILAEEDILNWWFRFGLRYENRWFYKPIWGCALCFAGQTAFWTYLINWIGSYFNEKAPFWRLIYFFIPKYHNERESLFLMAFFVSFTILQTFIFGNLLNRIKK